jgi:hypothetical protein
MSYWFFSPRCYKILKFTVALFASTYQNLVALKGLTCRKAATWDRRLYFPSDGRHAEGFFARKIQRLRLGLNPRTWVPEASMLTARPPKLLLCIILLVLPLLFSRCVQFWYSIRNTNENVKSSNHHTFLIFIALLSFACYLFEVRTSFAQYKVLKLTVLEKVTGIVHRVEDIIPADWDLLVFASVPLFSWLGRSGKLGRMREVDVDCWKFHQLGRIWEV